MALHVTYGEQVGSELRKLQWQTLRCDGSAPASSPEEISKAVTSINGSSVTWHRSLEDVPSDIPAIYIAHEFFDALPVHQFERTERGW